MGFFQRYRCHSFSAIRNSFHNFWFNQISRNSFIIFANLTSEMMSTMTKSRTIETKLQSMFPRRQKKTTLNHGTIQRKWNDSSANCDRYKIAEKKSKQTMQWNRREKKNVYDKLFSHSRDHLINRLIHFLFANDAYLERDRKKIPKLVKFFKLLTANKRNENWRYNSSHIDLMTVLYLQR